MKRSMFCLKTPFCVAIIVFAAFAVSRLDSTVNAQDHVFEVSLGSQDYTITGGATNAGFGDYAATYHIEIYVNIPATDFMEVTADNSKLSEIRFEFTESVLVNWKDVFDFRIDNRAQAPEGAGQSVGFSIPAPGMPAQQTYFVFPNSISAVVNGENTSDGYLQVDGRHFFVGTRTTGMATGSLLTSTNSAWSGGPVSSIRSQFAPTNSLQAVDGNFYNTFSSGNVDRILLQAYFTTDYIFPTREDALNSLPLISKPPLGAINDLIEAVDGCNLANGIANSLDSKIQNAVDAYYAENADQRADVINKLGATVNAIEAQRGNQIDDACADGLIDSVMRVIDAMILSQ